MRRKLFIVLLLPLMAISLSACSSDANEEKSQSEAKTSTTIPNVEIQDEVGEGSMYVVTAGGSSENDEIPVLYVDEDTDMTQIEIDTTAFDGTKLSFIYVDGKLNEKAQLAESAMTINLSGSDLLAGVHTVEVKQFEDDDESTEPITYKVAQFEVKRK